MHGICTLSADSDQTHGVPQSFPGRSLAKQQSSYYGRTSLSLKVKAVERVGVGTDPDEMLASRIFRRTDR